MRKKSYIGIFVYIGMTHHCSYNLDSTFLLQLSMFIVILCTMPAWCTAIYQNVRCGKTVFLLDENKVLDVEDVNIVIVHNGSLFKCFYFSE